MNNRTTPEFIMDLKDNEIFVFGSNEAGIHGAGAANTAYKIFGAEWGMGYGLFGRSFAIPTKDRHVDTLPVNDIQRYISLFIDYAKTNRDLIFLITPVGCGLAGYNPEDIAPFFKEAINLENVRLPESFWKILNEMN